MKHTRLWGLLGGGVATAIATVLACGQADRPLAAADGQGPGYGTYAGPCSPEGAVHECHVKVSQTSDGIVTCFIGQQECRGGQWSKCQGGDIKLQTIDYKLSPRAIAPLGLDAGPVTAEGGVCGTDPCDPYCNGYNQDAGLQADSGPVSTGLLPPGSPFAGPGGFVGKSDCSSGPGCNIAWPATGQNCNGAPKHYSIWDACLGDTHCERLMNAGLGTCVANWGGATGAPQDSNYVPGSSTWSTSVCPVGAGPDITVSSACRFPAGPFGVDQFSVCNRGNDATNGVDGGIDIYIDNGNANFSAMLSSDAGCATLAKPASCTIPVPAGGLQPGDCVIVTSANCPAYGGGNEVAFVNSTNAIAECGGQGTGSQAAGPACNNNWADVKGGTACGTITVYQPTPIVYTYTASCAPGTKPEWKWLTYEANVPATPPGGSVQFFGTLSNPYLDASTPASYPETIINDATTTTSVSCQNPGPDAGPVCPVDLLAWANAIGPTASSYTQLDIRVLITPSTDQSATPTVPNLQVSYRCVPAE